jgi:outer membrane protein assembly factor BamB
VIVVAAALLATVVISVVRSGGATTAKAAVRSTGARRPATRDRGIPPTVVPPIWSRTLRSWAGTLLDDHGRVGVVVGDNWVTAVVLRTGARRWEVPLARVQPLGALRDDTVLLATDHGFVALDRVTGTTRWQLRTPESPGRVALVGPRGTPPIAVVSTEEGGLAGLDIGTGHVRWSVRFTGRIKGTPAVDDASGTIATVWQGDGPETQLRVIDGATGTLRWEQPIAVMSGSPVVAQGIVVVGAGAGRHGSEVRAFALADGSPRWRAPVGAPFQEDLVPLVDGDDLYVVDQLGDVTRLELADGTRRWTTDTKALEVYVRPLRVGDAILVWNEAGEVVTVDRADGTIRARRRPAGLPVGLARAGRVVVVVQRLVELHALQAFAADRLAATARSRR